MYKLLISYERHCYALLKKESSVLDEYRLVSLACNMWWNLLQLFNDWYVWSLSTGNLQAISHSLKASLSTVKSICSK